MKTNTPNDTELTSLPVMESFLTVQGEGAFSGAAAFFIRLGGCDVGCVWCDVKESWDAAAHPHFTIDQIVDQAKSHAAEIVVITGGEPLMYNLDELTTALKKAGLRTHVETSGAHPISGVWDWVCFSPKKFKAPVAEFFPAADELKIIVFNKSDFKWAEEHAAQCPEKTRLYLQPEWSKKDQITPMIVEYVKKNPKWRISLQTHKYLDIP